MCYLLDKVGFKNVQDKQKKHAYEKIAFNIIFSSVCVLVQKQRRYRTPVLVTSKAEW